MPGGIEGVGEDWASNVEASSCSSEANKSSLGQSWSDWLRLAATAALRSERRSLIREPPTEPKMPFSSIEISLSLVRARLTWRSWYESLVRVEYLHISYPLYKHMFIDG